MYVIRWPICLVLWEIYKVINQGSSSMQWESVLTNMTMSLLAMLITIVCRCLVWTKKVSVYLEWTHTRNIASIAVDYICHM